MAEMEKGGPPGESHAAHNRYYEKLKRRVAEDIRSMLNAHGRQLSDVIDHDEIDEPKCVARILGYVMKHGDCMDAAKMTCLAAEWLHAHNELMEHESEDREA